MKLEMNGKPIEFIDLDPMWTQSGNPERIWSRDGTWLHLSATFHGDHEQYWIVEKRAGEEVGRYGWKSVHHIQWSSVGKTRE